MSTTPKYGQYADVLRAGEQGYTTSNASFSEQVQHYAEQWQPPPDTPWLTQLNLEAPRRNVQSLPQSYRRTKRIIDVVGSIGLGVLLAPVWLTFPLIIKLTSGPGPVLYQQIRVGLNNRYQSPAQSDAVRSETDRRTQFNYGKLFTIYKFRTMKADAEKDGAQLAQANDARVTKLGQFMRQTRIDEIPQLVNVLRGEMSLVGPRPERPVFVDALSREIPDYLDRLGLKPGLTGIAQIENGYDTDTESFRRKVAYDLQYLQNCCVRNDLKILARTVHVVVTGKGAL